MVCLDGVTPRLDMLKRQCLQCFTINSQVFISAPTVGLGVSRSVGRLAALRRLFSRVAVDNWQYRRLYLGVRFGRRRRRFAGRLVADRRIEAKRPGPVLNEAEPEYTRPRMTAVKTPSACDRR